MVIEIGPFERSSVLFEDIRLPRFERTDRMRILLGNVEINRVCTTFVRADAAGIDLAAIFVYVIACQNEINLVYLALLNRLF